MDHLSWGCPLNASKQSTMPAHVVAALQSCPGISSPSPEDKEGSQDSDKMDDTSPGVVRYSATIEPRTAPGLGGNTKNGRASQPSQRNRVPGSACMLQEGGIQAEDKLQTEAMMLPPFDERHGPGAQPRPVPLPEDSTEEAAMRRLEETRQLKRSPGPRAYTQDTAPGVTRNPQNKKVRVDKLNRTPATLVRCLTEILWHLSRTQPRVRGTLATFPEETSDAREPGAPSRDSMNPVLGSPGPVMACSGAGTISAVTVGSTRTGYSKLEDLRPDSDITPAISRGDMTGLPDSRHVDIKERLYPLSPADLELQLKALAHNERTNEWPWWLTLSRLGCSGTVLERQSLLVLALLQTSRGPPQESWRLSDSSPPLQTSGSPKEKGLDGGSYPTALTHLEGLDSGSVVIDPGIPPHLHETEAPDRRHDPRVREDSTCLEVADLEVRETVRSMDWPFQGLDESGFTALLHSRTRDPYPLCGVMTGSLAPLVLATIDGHSTQALVDTGASVTVISQEFWMLLGRPSLRTPSYGLVSAANAGISTLGFRHCSITLAGISTTFPVWVLEDSVTPCILGVNLLRKLHAR
ncbi:hypothetical protein H257_18331 [Aphanomyces astaci]|uniref:Peptidase A2 domain-containing protein n=1 Tax=Aphanomyces astaci TaxID=112090 RepID=W4FBH7_APHAT|nr:hypothetical protein H257_18331 [Aphanomyces astaci]ETV64850.1 hypothetical protein H257_18331 [Aphanomyces astaci]|eukprot:XP_009845669.1 hypothetical protein H257_18331 [Aphanomyces astaci]